MTDTMTTAEIRHPSIASAILAAVADGHTHRFAEIRRDLPGTRDAQAEALCDLVVSGQLDAVVTGTPFETFVAAPLRMTFPAHAPAA